MGPLSFYEKQVIGALVAGLITPSETGLADSDFSQEYRALFNVAVEIEREGEVFDPGLLYQRFSAEDPDSFFSYDDILLTSSVVHTRAQVFEAIKALRESSLKAFLQKAVESLASQNGSNSGGQLLARLKDVVSHASGYYDKVPDNFVFLGDVVAGQADLYQDMHEGKTNAISSGYGRVDDEILDGFSRGDEHVIVGQTGSGKSALALNFALRQAKKGVKVGFVSREMAKEELVTRLVSTEAVIPRWRIRRNLGSDTLSSLTQSLNYLKELPIAFDTATTDVESLRAQTRRAVGELGLQILYVDYLQLMQSRAEHSTRANEVQNISRVLKQIAMENNIPVVSLCQFNRGAAHAETTELLNYLKESSGIEQDASTILYLQTPRDEGRPAVIECKILLLKNRNGACFKPIYLDFRGETFTFTES